MVYHPPHRFLYCLIYTHQNPGKINAPTFMDLHWRYILYNTTCYSNSANTTNFLALNVIGMFLPSGSITSEFENIFALRFMI